MFNINMTEQFGMYQVELTHAGLNKYRVIKGRDRNILIQKLQAQQLAWEEQWTKVEARAHKQQSAQSSAERAQQLTLAAETQVAELHDLLSRGIFNKTIVDWERLKDHSEFSDIRPTPPHSSVASEDGQGQRKPHPEDPEYAVKAGFLALLFPELRIRAEEKASQKYEAALHTWEQGEKRRMERQRSEKSAYEESLKIYQNNLVGWDKKKQQFIQEQKARNSLVDTRRLAYVVGKDAGIEDYCDVVLSSSTYPDYFPQDYELDYAASTKTVVIDYQLPAPDQLPRVKEVKFVKSRNEMQQVLFKDAERQKLYDEVIYKTLLRTLHELFTADSPKRIQSIAFNGWVSSVDRATGQIVHACIVSIHVQRDEFLSFNLAEVDPKACFRKLKGVGSSQLHSVTPVPPVMSLNTTDKRFVQSHCVADVLAEGSNLASMDWQEFEHLVREVFEKEFAKDGAEVKVTRASRDGGVDAVVFNPDPLRGGKTVIQAKRYVNTVGVSAVRDLYGTLMNEGAGKGILVTTADYGPDAYEFIKGKPLVLINGAQLLYLLQQHGYKAKIDLMEARKLELAARMASPS